MHILTQDTIKNGVELQSLAVGYARGSRRERVVASNLNATAPPHTLTCLLGRNGRGKSTLLRTIAGLQTPISGNVSIGGQDATHIGTASMARTVGIVLTTRPDATDITVADTVALGRTPYTGFWGRLSTADKAVVERAINSVGIGDIAHRRVCSLSDGECQKTMIAKTLAQQTPVILLDEPTAFLDYSGKIELMRLLARLAHDGGKTIIMSTHDIETALHTADRLWIMQQDGMAEGSPHELAASGDIEAYIGRDDVRLDHNSLNLNIINV